MNPIQPAPINLEDPNLKLMSPQGTPVVQPQPAPTGIQNPVVPGVAPTQQQSQVYVVKQGDTLSRIAQQLGVAPNMLTGYASGNPNLIQPGEQLSVGQQPNPAFNTPPQPQNAPQTQVQTQQQQTTQQTAPTSTGQTTTPSGAVVNTQTGELISSPQQEKPSVFSSPLAAFADVYKQVYKELGLPDIKNQYDTLTKQYATLQNEMDKEIEGINVNPWLSQGSRDAQIKKIEDRYDRKTEILTNQLKLYDDLYTNARSEAQFVAQQAMSGYFQQANLDEKAIERAEKAADIEYSIQEVGGRTKRFGFDKQGNLISTVDLGASKTEAGLKPSTGAQQQNLAFYNRALNAIKDASLVENKIVGMGLPGQLRQRYAPIDLLRTQEGKLYSQAQRAFTEARLRKESGAAIPEYEYVNDAQTYFAQPGDDQVTIAQKKTGRGQVLRGLAFSSGNAYQEFYGEPFSPQNSVEGQLGGGGVEQRATSAGYDYASMRQQGYTDEQIGAALDKSGY